MFSIPSVSLMLGIFFSLGRAASHLPCLFLFTFGFSRRISHDWTDRAWTFTEQQNIFLRSGFFQNHKISKHKT
jgi:hypothetical protein